MPEDKYYETVEQEGLICERCGVPLVTSEVKLSYLGNGFPVQLPKCPQCELVFIPKELVTGKMLQVEKSLEDK